MTRTLDARLIRERLLGYLSGRTSLEAFHIWFVPATWDIESAQETTRDFGL